MIYKIKEGFVVRRIGEQIMAVPVGKQTSDIHGIVALTESAELMWHALENGADIDTLTNILTENYEVDPETARSDTEKFLEGLKKQGVLL